MTRTAWLELARERKYPLPDWTPARAGAAPGSRPGHERPFLGRATDVRGPARAPRARRRLGDACSWPAQCSGRRQGSRVCAAPAFAYLNTPMLFEYYMNTI